MLKKLTHAFAFTLIIAGLTTDVFADGLAKKDIINLSFSEAPTLRATQQEDGGLFISDSILGKRTETIYVNEKVQDFELVYTEKNFSFFQGFEPILYLAFEQRISAYLIEDSKLVLLDEIHTPERIAGIVPFKRTIVVGQIQNVRRFLKVELSTDTSRVFELNDGKFDLIDLREYQEVAPLWAQNLDLLEAVIEIDEKTTLLKQGTRFFLERTESWVFNSNQVVIYHLGDFGEQSQSSYDRETETLKISSDKDYLFYPHSFDIL